MLGAFPAFRQNLPAFPKNAGRDRFEPDCILSQFSYLIVLEFFASWFFWHFHSETAFRCPRHV